MWCTNARRRRRAYTGGSSTIDSSAPHCARLTIAGWAASAAAGWPRGALNAARTVSHARSTGLRSKPNGSTRCAISCAESTPSARACTWRAGPTHCSWVSTRWEAVRPSELPWSGPSSSSWGGSTQGVHVRPSAEARTSTCVPGGVPRGSSIATRAKPIGVRTAPSVSASVRMRTGTIGASGCVAAGVARTDERMMPARSRVGRTRRGTTTEGNAPTPQSPGLGSCPPAAPEAPLAGDLRGSRYSLVRNFSRPRMGPTSRMRSNARVSIFLTSGIVRLSRDAT